MYFDIIIFFKWMKNRLLSLPQNLTLHKSEETHKKALGGLHKLCICPIFAINTCTGMSHTLLHANGSVILML